MPDPYEQLGTDVQRLLAPNPGPMTLDGTNTWVLGDPRRVAPVIVDPGPLDEDHLRGVLERCGGRAAAVWVTHRHHDHTDGAARMAELAGCSVHAADPQHASSAATVLTDQARIELDDLVLTVLTTPGHTSDSLSFLVRRPDGNLLLTGDMVLGRGTTVITHPDGDLAAYFRSLDLLQRVVAEHAVTAILPGHGDRVTDPVGVLRYYRQHRRERLDQIRAALAAGDRTPMDVVRRVYADVDRSVWPAAEQSVKAQLDYLRAR